MGIASPLIWVETRGLPCAAAELQCAAARQELPFAVAGLPVVPVAAGLPYAAAVPRSNGAVNETALETSDGSNFTGSNGG